MVYRPAQVYNGSGWDDIGDKRIGASAGDIPQASVANLTSDLASKVDYATPTNAQAGTAYTFVADDAERITTASNGSAVTFTIPPQSSVGWVDDTILRVVNYGAGALTVAGGSGVTVTNAGRTLDQFESAKVIRTGSNAWTVLPDSGLSPLGGKILQIVRATDSTQRTTTSTSFTDASLSVTITPQKNNSAIILLSSTYVEASSAAVGHTISVQLTDNSNNALSGAEDSLIGTASGNATSIFTLVGYSTPATTSATTYKMRFKVSAGTGVLQNALKTNVMYALEVSA